jgi:hypothetical protein
MRALQLVSDRRLELVELPDPAPPGPDGARHLKVSAPPTATLNT